MNITRMLDQLLRLLVSKGSLIEKYLRPGLTPHEINQLTKGLPHPLPAELYELYQWRDGCDGEWEFFLFRDHAFLPLSEAIIVRNQLLNSPYVTEKSLAEFNLAECFPFADFEGSTYLVPIFGKDSARPVISDGEGVEVVFDTFETMIETLIEWAKVGTVEETEVKIDAETELTIWKKHNPNTFD